MAYSTFGSKSNYQKSKITNTGNFNRYTISKSSYDKHSESHQSTKIYEKKHNVFKNIENKDVEEINEWVNNINDENHDNMLEIYQRKKEIWKIHINKILIKLTRGHKIKMLDYILNEIKLIPSEKKKKNYTLLNENVWIGKTDIETEDYFDKCISTFDVLISNGYNFIEFSVLSNETTNKTEILNMLSNPPYFYQAIIKKNKIIPKELQNELFRYIYVIQNLKTSQNFLNVIQKNNNLLSTITTLINNYFTYQNVIEKRLTSTESFLGALISDKNIISSDLRDRLYDYYTKTYWNKDQFIQCLKTIFNKITLSNSVLFIDNMQFILSRNVDIMSKEIFKLLVFRESTNINEKNIVNCLFSDLVGRKDLEKYFQSIDIEEIKQKFVQNIIEGYHNWIKEIILMQKLSNPDVECDEFKKNDYSVLMMIFGIAYSKGYFKNEIIQLIHNIFINENVNMVKPFGIFLELSEIKDSNLSSEEFNLISLFIDKLYINSTSLKDKFVIEDILTDFVSFGKNKKSIREENINLFLKTKNFFIQNNNNKTKNSKKMNSFNIFNTLDSDNEDEDDDNELSENKPEYNRAEDSQGELNGLNLDGLEDEEELAEPNEKIMKNIILYLKSNDKENAIDDLVYFIEKSELELKEFAYGLIYCMGESSPNNVPSLNSLIEKIQTIKGFESMNNELKLLLENNKLIEVLKYDNPMLDLIINSLIL